MSLIEQNAIIFLASSPKHIHRPTSDLKAYAEDMWQIFVETKSQLKVQIIKKIFFHLLDLIVELDILQLFFTSAIRF